MVWEYLKSAGLGWCKEFSKVFLLKIGIKLDKIVKKNKRKLKFLIILGFWKLIKGR